AYVVAMGMDRGTNEELVLSLGLADVLPAGGTAEGTRMKLRVITASAPSFFSALTLANNLLERPLNLTHLKLLVFGQDLAKKGIGRHLDALVRWREFRRTVYTAVAEDKAATFLAALTAIKEEEVAKYLELALINQGITGLVPSSAQFLRFYNDIRSKSESPLAVMAAIRTKGSFSASAGKAATEAETPFRFAGAAVFKEGKMVGRLDLTETMVTSFMRGDLKQAFITLPFPKETPYEMDLRVIPARKPKLYVMRDKKEIRLRLILFLRGEVVNIERTPGAEAPLSLPAVKKAFQEWIEKGCRQVLAKAQAWRADFIGFTHKARWLVPDWPAWSHWNWEAAFAEAPFELKVEASIGQTGLILEKHNVREE
ncbi:MAG: Ger(x)C family spore germination protein, partial [Firmicutes bacterium]|nr:Ger(x)C family spore germination protein [Bacillota bacterium]